MQVDGALWFFDLASCIFMAFQMEIVIRYHLLFWCWILTRKIFKMKMNSLTDTQIVEKNRQWNDRTSTKYFPSNESGLKRHFSMTKKINFQKQHIHLDSMHQKIMWCSFLTVTYLCSTIWSLSLAFFGEKNHEALFCLATLSKTKNPSRKTIWTASNKLTILVKVVEVKMNRHTHMQNTQKKIRQIVTQGNQMTSDAFITYTLEIDGFLNG